jgi:hypothetical protein
MTSRRFLRIFLAAAVAGFALVGAACDPIKKTPPACNLDPAADFGNLFVGSVDVNGDGTEEVWAKADPADYPTKVTLFTIKDCRYINVLLNGSPVVFPLSVTGSESATGVGCLDLDLNGFLDFVVRRVATDAGGNTFDLQEVEYALIGTSLSFIDSHTQNIQGGASVLGDIGSLECGSVTYP